MSQDCRTGRWGGIARTKIIHIVIQVNLMSISCSVVMFIFVSAFVNRYRITSGYLSGIERDQVLSKYMYNTVQYMYNKVKYS